jgi:hypothetical protein
MEALSQPTYCAQMMQLTMQKMIFANTHRSKLTPRIRKPHSSSAAHPQRQAP